jgi:uncharacterized membrane protein YfcA
MTILGYGLAIVIGLILGLLGGGGAILTVPVLHYVLGYPVKVAIPMSLIVVGLTSGFGVVHHARAGKVRWRSALGFGPPAIVGAVLGAELGLRVDSAVQTGVLAAVLLLAGVAMFRQSPAGAASDRSPPPRHWTPFITLIGAAVGILTGFVGVGGGFLYVPALTTLLGIPMKDAIGTSLVLIVLSCTAGFLRYLGEVRLDWQAIGIFSALAFIGVAAGSRLIPYFSQQALKRLFAGLLLAMGTLVLMRG